MTCCPCSSMFGRCFVLVAAIVAAAFVTLGSAGPDEKPTAAVKSQPYPLATCIVSGEKLDAMGKPVVKEIDGRDVRFCCTRCVGKFEGDQASYMKKIDDQIISQQLKHYPLKTCVVMEEDSLSDDSKTVNYVYANRLVRFCCKGCIKDFTEDPAKYLAKIDKAVIAQQNDAYPMTTCPISGGKLGSMGDPVTRVYGVTMVKFCCNGCVSKFEADYATNMAKVTDAWKAKHADGKDAHAGHDHSHDHDHDGHQH